MTDLAVDTSVAVPYVLRSHQAHADVRRHLLDRRPSLTGHSLAETYSVLTRLPGDARLQVDDAVTLMDANFAETILLSPETARSVPGTLAPLGIAGGAVYDALVALAARDAGVTLATRDRRAAATYKTLDVTVELVAR
jgi:predicted nucleic acid-binding protein